MTHDIKELEIIKNETTGILDISIGDSKGMRSFMDEDGTIWFCLRDVLSAMGTKTRTNDVIPTITDLFGDGVVQVVPLQTPGGLKKIYFVSEESAVFLVFKSKSDGIESVQKQLISKISGTRTLLEALKNFEVPEDLPDMFVYAIMEEDTSNIKLGISRDPEARLKQLQTGNSSKLHLVGFRKAENRFADERVLHQKNEAYRIHGEWFFNEAKNTIAI